MSTMKLKNFLCKCGHGKEYHDYAGPPLNEEWCEFELENSQVLPFSIRCDCFRYRPDNLKYLEKQYNKRKKR